MVRVGNCKNHCQGRDNYVVDFADFLMLLRFVADNCEYQSKNLEHIRFIESLSTLKCIFGVVIALSLMILIARTFRGK